MATRTNLYKGFSTFEFQKNKSLHIRDIDLVKIDLLNHIFTRRGTRVMMPEFGSSIPELAFEPLDSILIDEVYAEITLIMEQDPRVAITNIEMSPDYDRNTLYVNVELYYIELDTVDEFDLNIQFEG